MDELTTTTGVLAIAASVLALLALAAVALLWRLVRRLRVAQSAVLGDRERDLVSHAADLERRFEALHEYVTDVGLRLDGPGN